MRVLLVDDNEDARDLLSSLLEMHGYAVAIAGDAEAALAVAATFKPDIAVLDIGLPGLDGWELGRRLRALDGLAAVRLIALTGYGSERDRQLSIDAGFDDHLLKPVDIAKLTRTFGPAR